MANEGTQSTASTPASPPDAMQPAPPHDPDTLLLRLVRERDVPCPRCGYNLRNLTRAVCPECREPLTLKVSAEPVHVWWLLVTLAPCSFSGIAAVILLYPILIFGPAPPEAILTCAFGLLSGMTGLIIALRSRAFLRIPVVAQAGVAAAMWVIHLVAFAIFLATA